jgi:hypothetical protein
VAVQAVKGQLREGGAEMVITSTEMVNRVARTQTVKKAIKNREVFLGDPVIVTAATVDEFDF